jgi:hypothetical protein
MPTIPASIRANSRVVGAFSHLLMVGWPPGVDETENSEFAIARRETTARPTRMRKRDGARAEALGLAGSRKASLRVRAVALAPERGVMRTCDLSYIGIPRCYLSRMCHEGLLSKVGYGLCSAAKCKAA